MLPFDNREGCIWLDGAFVPWSDARLHVCTHALHYGSAVFEGERMYNGHIFELEAHTRRLFQSAETLDFEIPFTEAEINTASIETCRRNNLEDCYVRPIAWRGAEQLSVSALHTKTHVAIAVWEWPKYFDAAKLRRGIRLTSAKYRRPPADAAPTSAKAAGLYMICTISKNAAERAGYDDALMLDSSGNVAETTGANIFFIRDGAIYTPKADSFLDGITRRTVIALARAKDLDVIETRIRPDELDTFSECFVTGTAAEVTPVAEIGVHAYKPGAITFDLMETYTRHVTQAPPSPVRQLERAGA
ncbi:branched-chain amino acid aminotransferase [Candidatus Viadribacter manganicus]|uniref:Branched-chain-amino-acid aminotransferase n=1 Tax=Candidatus Viadribacter manganicus TaxID=1759059 RepID=A0A1B1AIK6_9PROT|nr:branched-chain amino acid aminotransferase [Candidatus Viadribacter manganicus]ANP46350.1 branched chain amino acid aminotransferase [Candidatus Viadribacter manganicus]